LCSNLLYVLTKHAVQHNSMIVIPRGIHSCKPIHGKTFVSRPSFSLHAALSFFPLHSLAPSPAALCVFITLTLTLLPSLLARAASPLTHPSSSSSPLTDCPGGSYTSGCYTLPWLGNSHSHTTRMSNSPGPHAYSSSSPHTLRGHHTYHSPTPDSPASGTGSPTYYTSPDEHSYRCYTGGTTTACSWT